ncbi:hypothetical protein QU593_18865 [Rossellomorea marisflavi]|uniref:hypothetical protein n=1 Tax=Rossellomorea marisflavi TaxID=189381 RepID=UPI0025AF2B58|nr:hypothetical protein [Rossellomorea marisflavi]WJV18168.1 hypothetical protein QU593_18865 [Rossellomorea marisflavi]
MTDTGWSIILNAVAALGFAISLFYYDPFFYTRMMACLFALSEVVILLQKRRIKKSVYIVYSMIILFLMVIANQYDQDRVDVWQTIILCICVFTLLRTTYRTLYHKPRT